jgi:DNA polymerase III epsilon subunit-like protein
MRNTNWVLLDTETTGFRKPVYVVEIGAQRMCGWAPNGPSFRMLLNQNTEIPPEASRVHGYTREILERDGEPAEEVYKAFREYVKGLPLVAYNNSYDLNDVLLPEWNRLGIERIGDTGFCALKLAQRLLDPVPAGNCKLQTLRQYYRLPERGAHTAMGDVETVIDLMEIVLKPIAEERNLNSWDAICALCEEEWFPTRINFGKFKGYNFEDALINPELKEWLVWLASSSRKKSSAMGNWYLSRLAELAVSLKPRKHSKNKSDARISSETAPVPFEDRKITELQALIAGARNRLAQYESEYSNDKSSIDSIQAKLFLLVKDSRRLRDALKLVVYYREKYLETLLKQGSEEADDVVTEFVEAKEHNNSEHEQADTIAQGNAFLTDEEEEQIKPLWRKLVRLFHPDRYTTEPEKQKTYEKLTAVINTARDEGNINLLQEIAGDPEAYIQLQGWQAIDLGDPSGHRALEKLYDALQIEILEIIEALQILRESSGYELLLLSIKNPAVIETVAEKQKEQLQSEIEQLRDQAFELKEEIELLDPAGVDGIA